MRASDQRHCCVAEILGFATEYSTSVRKFTATYVSPICRASSSQYVPALRIAIGGANRNAPVGMTVLMRLIAILLWNHVI